MFIQTQGDAAKDIDIMEAPVMKSFRRGLRVSQTLSLNACYVVLVLKTIDHQEVTRPTTLQLSEGRRHHRRKPHRVGCRDRRVV